MNSVVVLIFQRGLLEAVKSDHRVTAEIALAAEVKRLLAGGKREEAAERSAQ